jgi:DNA-binding FadR family transcriptional regulator
LNASNSAVFKHASRRHVADDVFDQIAAAILRGDLSPGDALPSERVLTQRFDVSRMTVRQAVHRLAEHGLVRVKHGGATIVRDPNEATDLRVLALFYRFAPQATQTPSAIGDMIEKQYLQGMSIVEVASRRAPPEALKKVEAVVAAAEQTSDADLADFAPFDERFWRALAEASGNRIFLMEVAWWYDALSERPVPPEVLATPARTRLLFHRELIRRIKMRDEPVEYYLATVRPLLDAVLARASSASSPPQSGTKGKAS